MTMEILTKALDKIESKQDEIKISITEHGDRLTQLEQKGGAPADLGDGRTNAGVGQAVVKAMNLDGLRSGSVKSARVALKSLQQKAALTSTTAHSPAERDRDILPSTLPRPIAVRDLLPTRPTTANSIEYLSATRTGNAAIQAVEGDQKAEAAIALALQTTNTRTIAVWVPASRQVLDDNQGLSDFIELELLDALRLEEDAQLLKGPGTGSTISGLWTNAVAYNRAVAGDTPNDTLRRAITQVQLARGVPSGIVLNPVGLESLELEKDSEGRYLVSYTVTDGNARTTTWRVPVVVTDALAATEFLVGDFARAAQLYDRQEAIVEISKEHSDFFVKNLLAILAEERVALAVKRPSMLVKGTFDAE